MAVDSTGEWDGVCACGKVEQDGKRCILGATHQPLPAEPWALPSTAKAAVAPSFPWTQNTSESNGTTGITDLSPTPWMRTT